jgi:putative photosynthetic complex assembly protein
MMTETFEKPIVGRTGLLAIAGLVAVALTAATTTRLTGIGGTRMTLAAPVESRDFQFADGPGGTVLVYDASDRSLIDTISPGTNGFVRVVLRGLARDRKLGAIGAEPPFRLTRFADGRMVLTDPTTAKQVDLAAFGASNAYAFTRLMTMRSTT